jgi:hypothetical protein
MGRGGAPCRFVIDGNKVILLREDVDQKVDDQTFLVNEVGHTLVL